MLVCRDNHFKRSNVLNDNESEADMTEIIDENGNYIYPTDVVLDEPNIAIGCIPTIVYPQVDGITPTVVMPSETKTK